MTARRHTSLLCKMHTPDETDLSTQQNITSQIQCH